MNRFIRFGVLSVLALILLSYPLVQARALGAALPELKRVGEGSHSWFGLSLYSAELLSFNGKYRRDEPYAIRITYQINISRERLAKTTVREIEKLFGKHPNQGELEKLFFELFPDVKKNEKITGLHYPGKEAMFYHDGKLLGVVSDSQLASHFFAIWLDPDTTVPELREKLIGRSG